MRVRAFQPAINRASAFDIEHTSSFKRLSALCFHCLAEQPAEKGMAYADLRAAVMEHGSQPAPDTMCKSNVVGADYKRQCASSPELCKPCEEMPELSECSGDAVCVVRSRHTDSDLNQQLEVTTYGNIGQWNVHGPGSQLGVTG